MGLLRRFVPRNDRFIVGLVNPTYITHSLLNKIAQQVRNDMRWKHEPKQL